MHPNFPVARMTRTRPAYATPTQIDTTCDELEHVIRTIRNLWPELARHARDMGSGFPATSLSPGGTHIGFGDPVADAVERNETDHATEAAQWLDQLIAVRLQMLTLVRRGNHLAPAVRTALPQICVHCGTPAAHIYKINDQPYHAETCYQAVKRSQRKTLVKPPVISCDQ